jgi:hypothetical protein
MRVPMGVEQTDSKNTGIFLFRRYFGHRILSTAGAGKERLFRQISEQRTPNAPLLF